MAYLPRNLQHLCKKLLTLQKKNILVQLCGMWDGNWVCQDPEEGPGLQS